MNKYIAMYLRLSQDDDNLGESNSITSQRHIIERYIATVPDFAGSPIREFIDDGFSGTGFDRPGVKRLLESVRKDEVSCIIVKDFSRFGRQYLQVSKFIEQIFPCLDVRFIAVNDHYDSNNHKGAPSDIDIPVRNMINAMYSRDISKKVKSSKRTQLQKGIFSNAFAPYGYKKDESNRHRLLIDEPAAEVVRLIFALANKGRSAFQIADKLNADGVVSPAVYKKNNGSKLASSSTVRAVWTNGIISRILRDERYTGTLIGGQRETIGVGSGKKRHNPKETWVRIPGAIPAIIPPEIWDNLAAKRQVPAKPAKPNTDRILYKKVRCGYCAHILQYIGGSPKPYYLCGTARFTGQFGCGRERFREKLIIDAVKAIVQIQFAVVPDLDKLSCSEENGLAQSAETSRVTTAKLDDEVKQLQTHKLQLYERYKANAIDKETFIGEREVIDAKISAKIEKRDGLITGSTDLSDALNPAHQFLRSLIKCQTVSPIPENIINEFVETVFIYDLDRIKVKFSFMDRLCTNKQERP